METINLKDITDYIKWFKSEFGHYPEIHLDEVLDLIANEKLNNEYENEND